MIDPKEMTIFEIRDYLNSLTNEELEKELETLDLSEMDGDLDPLDLLKASRLYDFLQYRKGGDATVEL